MQYRTLCLGKRFLMLAVLIALSLIATGITIGQGLSRKLKQSSSSNRRNMATNLTKALQIVSIDPNEDSLFFTVKNVSNKKVTGFTVGFGSEKIDFDFISTDDIFHTLDPGQTSMYSVSITSQQTVSNINLSDLSILTAMLNKDEYDGDADIGQAILERRKEEKRFLELILPMIMKFTDLPDSEIATALAQLKANIVVPPKEHRTDLTSSLGQNSNNRQDMVLEDIEEFDKSGGGDIRNFLRQLHNKYSQILDKY